MTGRRIEFPSDDAARFNALRDEWRGAAASRVLPRSAMRIVAVLPTFVSREFGYAFPTDEQLAGEISADAKTVKRGLTSLEGADLIERVLQTKRGEKGEVIGKLRRIYLCLPTEGTISISPKGQNAGSPKGHEAPAPKGQPPKGQPQPKGQKSSTEGTYGCPYIPDTHTPDQETGSGDRKVSVYEEQTSTIGESLSLRAPLSLRVNYPAPPGWGEDVAFLAAFDERVAEAARAEIPAGGIEALTARAFGGATASDESFMPCDWIGVSRVRDDSIREYFRRRAAAIIHRRDAA